MATYRVTWEIDIEADSPEEAAHKALTIQRDAGSEATVFRVDNEHIDPVELALNEADSSLTAGG